MAATTYTDQQNYAKYAHSNHKKDCGCGGECHECKKENCGCCPPGLVSIFDDKGQNIGCVTPNDAELYKKNTFTCQDGYVKLYNDATGEFLGCVSEENYAAINTNQNEAPANVPPTGITILTDTGNRTQMPIDTTRTYVAYFTPPNTTNQGVIWSTSNAAVGPVDPSTGVVTTSSATGTFDLTATSIVDPTIHSTITITVS